MEWNRAYSLRDTTCTGRNERPSAAGRRPSRRGRRGRRVEAWLTGVCGCAVLLLCAAARLPQVGHLEVLQLIAEHSGDLDASDKRGRFRVVVCFVCCFV